MNLGTVITSKRIEKQLTQEHLAKNLSVTKEMVISWEDGDIYPDIDYLVALAKVLDISLDELFLTDDPTTLKSVMKQTTKKELHFAIFISITTLSILLAILLFSLLNEDARVIVSVAVIIGELINLFALSYYIKKIN